MCATPGRAGSFCREQTLSALPGEGTTIARISRASFLLLFVALLATATLLFAPAPAQAQSGQIPPALLTPYEVVSS